MAFADVLDGYAEKSDPQEMSIYRFFAEAFRFSPKLLLRNLTIRHDEKIEKMKCSESNGIDENGEIFDSKLGVIPDLAIVKQKSAKTVQKLWTALFSVDFMVMQKK